MGKRFTISGGRGMSDKRETGITVRFSANTEPLEKTLDAIQAAKAKFMQAAEAYADELIEITATPIKIPVQVS
jgi:hypothetical protein